MLEMLCGKVHHATGLATLAHTFHDQRLVRGIIQPRLEYVFYLSLIHKYTFSCRLFRVFHTFSYRLLAKIYTFSCNGIYFYLFFCVYRQISVTLICVEAEKLHFLAQRPMSLSINLREPCETAAFTRDGLEEHLLRSNPIVFVAIKGLIDDHSLLSL